MTSYIMTSYIDTNEYTSGVDAFGNHYFSLTPSGRSVRKATLSKKVLRGIHRDLVSLIASFKGLNYFDVDRQISDKEIDPFAFFKAQAATDKAAWEANGRTTVTV